MATNAERQRRLRAARAERGIVPVTVWVSREHQSVFVRLALMLNENSDLEIGPLRDTKSGKLVRFRG